MTIPVGTIIGAGTKIAEYFGLIEGVDSKITKLLHQAFNSAVASRPSKRRHRIFI